MTHGMLEETRYPKAGDPNPLVKLGVVNIETTATTWMEQNPDMEYTAWVFWTPDGSDLLYQQLNRDQNVLYIYKADPAKGKAKKIYEETQPTWVEFFEEINFLADGKSFILRTNRDGWYNLYHYDLEGKLINKITDNDWRVTSLTRIDEANNQVFFTGTGPDGTESHLFSVGLDGKNQKQLTDGAGMHSTDLSPDGAYFIDQFSNVNNPGEIHLRSTTGKRSRLLGADKTDANQESGLKVEQFTIKTEDGFELPAQWVLPANFDSNKKYPVIFQVYGGPDAGGVYNRYRDYTRDVNVSNGVIRFTVDHRASGKFGKKGLDYMHRNLGKWEMNDYIECVKWLRKQGFIDETKVGITGSSYGGYVTALALTYAGNYFTHGISGSPVTDWRLYDNVYTERYMDTPQDNPEGYNFGSVMTHADKLKGKLLIIHGTIDDNVHFQNTVQLVSKLQDLGKDFEVMFYPGGRHGWGGAKRMHSTNLANKFWEKYFSSTSTEIRP
jgi:dipeptidyl-peptidase-4